MDWGRITSTVSEQKWRPYSASWIPSGAVSRLTMDSYCMLNYTLVCLITLSL